MPYEAVRHGIAEDIAYLTGTEDAPAWSRSQSTAFTQLNGGLAESTLRLFNYNGLSTRAGDVATAAKAAHGATNRSCQGAAPKILFQQSKGPERGLAVPEAAPHVQVLSLSGELPPPKCPTTKQPLKVEVPPYPKPPPPPCGCILAPMPCFPGVPFMQPNVIPAGYTWANSRPPPSPQDYVQHVYHVHHYNPTAAEGPGIYGVTN